MKRLIVLLLVIGGVGYIVAHNSSEKDVNAVEAQSAAAKEHTAMTQMALESKAKAKQAVKLASVDPVAEYDKMNSEQ